MFVHDVSVCAVALLDVKHDCASECGTTSVVAVFLPSALFKYYFKYFHLQNCLNWLIPNGL